MKGTNTNGITASTMQLYVLKRNYLNFSNFRNKNTQKIQTKQMKNTKQKMIKTATEKPKSLTYTSKRNNPNSEKKIFFYKRFLYQ